MAEVAVLVPVLKRPHRVKPLLDSLEGTDCTTVFICDPDDHDEIQAVVAEGARCTRMLQPGGYARKINLAVEVTNHPLVFLAADDLEFRAGWFDKAREEITNGFHVVGVNDLIDRPARPEHATHFLMTREYATEPTLDGANGPLCELYHHWWIDDELIATATRRGAYTYCEDAVVEHLHQMNGKAPDDEVYAKGRARWRDDRRLWRRRRQLL